MSHAHSAPPTFAVVGKVNAGKSSVLATLLEVDDEKILRISSTPGETTTCQEFPVTFDKEDLITFIDTPGFSRPVDAIQAIKALESSDQNPTHETLKHFVEKFKDSGEFEDECRLLEPLLNGSGLLYVIDPSKPLRESFIAEMEILRWTGRPRLALLNQKGESQEFLTEWKTTLGSYFNLVRTFNAHTARYDERLRLIRSLLEIDEKHSITIKKVISYLELEWDQRREESTEVIISFLEKALSYKQISPLSERESNLESRKERILKNLSNDYFDSIRSLEKKMQAGLLKLYKHHLFTTEQTTKSYESLDLFSEETWQKWGLNRAQLTMAGGATGAAGGLMVDIGTGGLTHGFGTLVGALGGGLTAFFKGGSLPKIGFDLGSGLKVESSDGSALSVGPPKSDNFAWVLLDSSLNYYVQIISKAHAIRQKATLSQDSHAYSQDLTNEQRGKLAKWFSSCQKGNPDRGLEPEIFALLQEVLLSLETST